MQAEVLSLLQDVQAETGMGLVLITRDLGVVAEGPEPILSCRDLAKSCGGFDALKGVDFDLQPAKRSPSWAKADRANPPSPS